MLTPEQITEIRAKSGLPPLPQNKGTQPQGTVNYPGKYDYLKKDNKPGFIDSVKKIFSKRAGSVKDTFTDTVGGKINPAETGIQTVGAVAGGLTDLALEGIKAITPEPIKGAVKSGLEGVGKILGVSDTIQKLDEWSKAHPRAAKDLQSLIDIASIFPVGKGAEVSVKGVQKGASAGIKIAKQGTEAGVDLSKKVVNAATEAIKPLPSPIEATGQILQGNSKDVKKGVEALSSLDTTGVKTFKDLNLKINDKIKELSGKVDADLGADPTKKPLKELTVTAKTNSGKKVSFNPVKIALNQLNELYVKTGDVVKSANIKELIKVASKDGLNKLEINNIARTYGSEFGEKAFSKLGDPLTSVNAQMYENTRKSLKDLARSGLNGNEAKTADKMITSLYNTQRLVNKNIEAVNKLKQKINKMGILEQAGHFIAKYSDVLTGGTIRGLIGGLLPRGAGYKTLNALDIESQLERNLSIVQNALKEGADKNMILGELKKLK